MPTRGFRRGGGSDLPVPGWWDNPEPDASEPAHTRPADTTAEPAPARARHGAHIDDRDREDTAPPEPLAIASPVIAPPASRADLALDQAPTSSATSSVAIEPPAPVAPAAVVVSSGAVVALPQPVPAVALPRPFVWPVADSAALAQPDPRWLPPPVHEPKPPRRVKTGRWRRRARQETSPRPLSRAVSVERSLASWEPVSVTEACGYAVRFAADYLSWDELEPTRRPAALRQYLADPGMADVGWSGQGRQRAEWATAGRTVELASGSVVVVEVTARVVVFHRTPHAPEDAWRPPVGEATPSLAVAPSSAPPPVVPGWEAGSAWWVRIAPPVRRDHDGRLVIDLGLDLSAMQS